jgi:hypothetical protein
MTAPNSSVTMGFQAKLYHCVAGIGATPTWVEAKAVQNVALNLAKGEGDVSIRAAAPFKLSKGALIDASIELNFPYVKTDPFYAALLNSYLTGDPIGIACMDGDITVEGSQGLWADMEVMNFPRQEDIDKNIDIKVTLKPTYPTTTGSTLNVPAWTVIEGA